MGAGKQEKLKIINDSINQTNDVIVRVGTQTKTTATIFCFGFFVSLMIPCFYFELLLLFFIAYHNIFSFNQDKQATVGRRVKLESHFVFECLR